MREWNEAIEAAARLIGETGYTYVRRPLDLVTMTQRVEIFPGRTEISGEYDEATGCSPDPMAAAAILSLRRNEPTQ